MFTWQLKLFFASFAIFLLMIPTNSVFATHPLLDPEPENNTIPLWGPTWCNPIITWRIDNAEKITDTALNEMRDGIQAWEHHSPQGVTLREVVGDEAPDMIIKFKKGGGMVQGQALQRSDDGCFISVKINVSGKAFGQDNPEGQVKSITMQEVGHGLGFLHSDNTKDVMYGTVQDPPNVLLSQCDITAWSAVMAWVGGDPSPPTVDSVTCNVTDTGGNTGSVTPTSIDITNGLSHNSQNDDGNYQHRDRVHIFVNTNVSGASVHIVIDAPKSLLSGDTTTDENGVAHIHYKVNAGRDGTGEYHIFATVTNDSGTLSCEHSDTNPDSDTCLAHFSVS